ncbi:phage antirepressor KilAC domain-containing protein [Carboxylicivirga marina]|uniref:Phage antirepressor KilAC domain-containing protein n=1 Tax=Carboxylicivirga marina TaxID=2800988 RepID=A0ABS1HRC3_9BACT|nr:phage antirepressor KilAC domain-containing protein [Carboxylicivirga marina]MBK3519724.1 phage antirepressor KilAC domain-containing protein [Carboxylicivirga marina]
MIKIFQNNQFGEIRVATNENNEPVFCLKDLCNALGLSNNRKVKSQLDEDVTLSYPLETPGGLQNTTFVTEPGMYSVIIRSDSPIAKPMQRWITHDVLPSIRKHGTYMTSAVIEKALSDPDTLIQLATTLKEERKQKELYRQQAETQTKAIMENAPKVQYYDEVLQSPSTCTTSQVAKELGMTAIALNKFLAAQQIQYKQGGVWLLYAKYQDKGYTKTKTNPYNDHGEIKTTMLTVWTEKGREFIHGIVNQFSMVNTPKQEKNTKRKPRGV